jgi:hypothetical protein
MCINVPSTALSWGTYELVKSRLFDYARDWTDLMNIMSI